MPAERRDFFDQLEPILYLDATFTIAERDTNELFHIECDVFRRRMETESVLAVASDFVYNELAFHHLQSALAAEGERQGKSWRWVKSNMPHIFTAAMVEVQTSRMELERTTLRLPISDAVILKGKKNDYCWFFGDEVSIACGIAFS